MSKLSWLQKTCLRAFYKVIKFCRCILVILNHIFLWHHTKSAKRWSYFVYRPIIFTVLTNEQRGQVCKSIAKVTDVFVINSQQKETKGNCIDSGSQRQQKPADFKIMMMMMMTLPDHLSFPFISYWPYWNHFNTQDRVSVCARVHACVWISAHRSNNERLTETQQERNNVQKIEFSSIDRHT